MSAAPRGLPARLPDGERVMWQGAPDWRILARRTFHVRKVALYFGLIVAWMAIAALRDGTPPAEAAVSILRAAAIGSVPVALILAYAWMVARMTVYTVTDRRVVLRLGIALPVTINLPLIRIAEAGMTRKADGSGSIALSLTGNNRLAYAVLWPHARPWRFGKAEPMLRGLRDVQPIAQMLARALAASADMAAPVLHSTTEHAATVPHSATGPHAAAAA